MQLELISFDTCPYVERSRIVLFEKEKPFEERLIDLSQKPEWFLALSPRGKVPVLLIGDRDDRPIFESNVINELLEELVPEPPMLPRDPLARAEARAWIEFNSQSVMAAFGRYLFASDDEAVRSARAELHGALARVNTVLARRERGPYFQGPDFGLIDAVYAPIFNRWDALERLGEAELLSGLDHLADYGAALRARPSVQRARGEGLTEKTVERVRARRGEISS